MTISVIGLNHKSANIDIRGKFSFTADSASLLLRRIKKVRDINEVNMNGDRCSGGSGGGGGTGNYILNKDFNVSLFKTIGRIPFLKQLL